VGAKIPSSRTGRAYSFHRIESCDAAKYSQALLDTTSPKQVLVHWEGLAPAPFLKIKHVSIETVRPAKTIDTDYERF
jgi:hypothetical protein